MFVLLGDGAGLAARQSATLLSQAGHRVEALSLDPLCLCRLTRHVRKVHRVPGLRPGTELRVHEPAPLPDLGSFRACFLVAFSRGSSYALGYALASPGRVRGLVVGDYLPRHAGLPADFAERQLRAEIRGVPVAQRMPEHAVRAWSPVAVKYRCETGWANSAARCW